MSFNSIDFSIFLPVIFILYWFAANRSLRLQNVLLVAASYVFYAWWDFRFLSLILFSTLVDYGIGRALLKEEKERKRKLLLWVSVGVNLGLLGFFKYYNFFLDSFIQAFSFFGASVSASSLQLVLPVGISFYTFQTLSYTIDVYRRKLEPTQDLIAFSAFVSFFPQLVAGPIERATNLLPQFYVKRKFDYENAVDGVQQIIWGLVKKIIIADNCAYYVNLIFDNAPDYSGSTYFLGAFLFAFQVYGDFSGYSDIAIGTSKLFGFNLKQNFAFPFFSRDIAEHWRRWHISLSTWFRDYLYIPLGGSRGGLLLTIRNIFIMFLVSGLWHGANWTYVLWGALNALYFLPLLITKSNRNNLGVVAQDRIFPNLKETFQMASTFCLAVLGYVFFRAETVGHAVAMFSGIFSPALFSKPAVFPSTTLALIAVFLAIEWPGRSYLYAIGWLGKVKHKALKYSFLYLLIMAIVLFGANSKEEFIYFQF